MTIGKASAGARKTSARRGSKKAAGAGRSVRGKVGGGGGNKSWRPPAEQAVIAKQRAMQKAYGAVSRAQARGERLTPIERRVLGGGYGGGVRRKRRARA